MVNPCETSEMLQPFETTPFTGSFVAYQFPSCSLPLHFLPSFYCCLCNERPTLILERAWVFHAISWVCNQISVKCQPQGKVRGWTDREIWIRVRNPLSDVGLNEWSNIFDPLERKTLHQSYWNSSLIYECCDFSDISTTINFMVAVEDKSQIHQNE